MLVGAGQSLRRPADGEGTEPLALMVAALRSAAEDASAPNLLRRADCVAVVSSLGWRVGDPAGAVAEALGTTPRRRLRTATGGNGPLSLLHHLGTEIASGAMDVALVTGAEAFATVWEARRAGLGAPSWLGAPGGAEPEGSEVLGAERSPATEAEEAAGLRFPVHAYALMEQAIRGTAGRSLTEQAEVVGALWSRFSEVAATNPWAWLPKRRRPDEIVTPGPANRPIALPYPKLCTANMQVDMGAAVICCSLEAARAFKVPTDALVFLHAGAEAHDHWYLSERPRLDASPAISLAGSAAMTLARVGPDDLAAVDLYSCFPSVVQIAARELGLPLADANRPLTVTGGLTFGGGPGNNYATHGVATMMGRLRGSPGAVGLVTGLGWYATKHAVSLLGTRPPDHPYVVADVQADVDRLPKAAWAEDLEGTVEVETYTVTYERSVAPERGLVVCRDPKGTRSWVGVEDHATVDHLASTDALGAKGTVRAGRLELR